ncbi:hypothetical protein HanXRQr2_Chr16g0742411 [Helianthus annuus]|uniref:Uncharacterized protein n=1 Tax=Helianthus annuus TaxID=4232 RepID=A0A251RXD6_HELAN|nr:hypothetical protein HanXRQr2_Chr16g0742411 [Helianthus annuus]KAJ0437730.1 hypothetical protein HanHA300_Chr16g0605561 [Helianthus annuus]KAJ0460050.1 hypothetical protein HanHA89_Chr16g0656111 [Helianthus annuus]KAJ0640496.1 hypothetical protein HanLR1_Chr16g0616161 [Helianthus annuus]
MELIIKINAGLGMEFGMYNSFLNIWILVHIVSLKNIFVSSSLLTLPLPSLIFSCLFLYTNNR